MYRLIILLLALFIASGCGRTGDLNQNLETKSHAKMRFVTVEKSRFVHGDDPFSGHYQTIVKTLDKPEIYAHDDKLAQDRYYTLFENGRHKDESVVTVEKSNNEVENNVLLLLDLSGSIIDTGCKDETTPCGQLLKASDAFIDNIINHGKFKIAIYYFNSKKNIIPLNTQTEFPTGNATILKNAIAQLKDETFIERYLKGYDNSTNLYGAVKQSGEKMCSWINCDDTQSFEIGSIVIFTDGRDLANLVSKKTMLKSLKKNLQYYTIGIGNADNKTLIEISGKAHHFEASQDNIESAFEATYNYILFNSSFYRINYCPSTLEGKVRIKIRFYDPDNGIKADTQEETLHLDLADIRCDI